MIDYLYYSHHLIFLLGWMAGFGVVKGFVKKYDHCVMDELCHNCLVEGARAATSNLHRFKHLDN